MNFLKASWRGVPFGVLDHGLDGGRRTVTHEFPQRDVPFTEDFGLRAEAFSLNAFVLDDTPGSRDALIAACRGKGVGTLVHPWLGTMDLYMTSWSLREAFEGQRESSFTLSFVQVGEAVYPAPIVNPGPVVAQAATKAIIRAAERMKDVKYSHQAKAVQDATTTAVTAVSDQVKTAGQKAARPRAFEGQDALDKIASASSFVRDCTNVVNGLSDPRSLAFSLSDVIFRVAGLGMSSIEAYVAYKRLFSNVSALFGAMRFNDTPKGRLIRSNAYLLRDLTNSAVLGSLAFAAVEADWRTYQAAYASRSEIASMFDSAMTLVEDDDLFAGLQDVRTQALLAIPAADELLLNVVRIPVAEPCPSLVLSYDLMAGSVDEDTIVSRNRIRNPWFCPNGLAALEIEVLR